MYRRTFGKVYELVVTAIHQRLKLEPTGRPAKSTTSVIEKLQRETIRLSQMQDIAGCRLIVRDIAQQDRVVSRLLTLFPAATVMDRRRDPSNGYRAMHVIARAEGYPIEVQVRSRLQHLWAEVSEKLSDIVDPGLKYGRGPTEVQTVLMTASRAVAGLEDT